MLHRFRLSVVKTLITGSQLEMSDAFTTLHTWDEGLRTLTGTVSCPRSMRHLPTSNPDSFLSVLSPTSPHRLCPLLMICPVHDSFAIILSSGRTTEMVLPVSTVSLQALPATVPVRVSQSTAPPTNPALNDVGRIGAC